MIGLKLSLRAYRGCILAQIAALSVMAGAQTLTITSGVQKYGALTNTSADMSGNCELWVTNSTTPLSACSINLDSTDYTNGNGSFTLSWPADHTGWRLQANTNPILTGFDTNWFDVPGSNATNSMILPMVSHDGSVFYRLTYP
jgi:hypothetical protein